MTCGILTISGKDVSVNVHSYSSIRGVLIIELADIFEGLRLRVMRLIPNIIFGGVMTVLAY